MADVVEINVSTGEIVERDYTKEELDQLEKDKIENEKIALELKKEYDQKIKERSATVDKFISLGFSEEEIEKIVPSITPDYRIVHLL